MTARGHQRPRRLAWALALSGALACGCTSQPAQCVSLRPVLFVHGSGLDSSTWEAMRTAFLGEGYPAAWLIAPDLEPNDGSNIEAAMRQVAPAVDALLANAATAAQAGGCAAPDKVDIVAHSMGAVSGRWYVSKIDASRVRNVIGIAPAHHGSDALCGLQGAGNRELCPAFAEDALTHPLQVQLNGTPNEPRDETPFGAGEDAAGIPSIPPDATRRVNYTTFRLDPDEWIRPARSAVLDGAGGLELRNLPPEASITSSGNVLWERAVAHDDLPEDPLLIGTILASLQHDRGE